MRKAKLNTTKEKKEELVTNDFSIKRFVITILIISVVLVASYFLTDFIVKKNVNNDDNTIEIPVVRTENTINYADIDSIESKSYQLLFNASDDENNNSYDAYINFISYFGLTSDFYYIDLGADENKDLVAEEASLEDLKNIKVKETTLVTVEDGKITETYEGSEKILEYLSSFLQIGEESDEEESSDETASDSKTDSTDESK